MSTLWLFLELAGALVALLVSGLVGYGLGLRDNGRELAELRRRQIKLLERQTELMELDQML